MTECADSRRSNRALLRRVALLMGLCATTLMSNGCLWSVNNDFPIYMNADAGALRFTWCGESEGPYSYLKIEYRYPLSNLKDPEVLEGHGRFFLRPGETFASDVPPAVVYVNSSGKFDMQAPSLVFLNVSESADQLSGLSAQFEVKAVSDVTGGNWLSSGGRISDNPCGDVGD